MKGKNYFKQIEDFNKPYWCRENVEDTIYGGGLQIAITLALAPIIRAMMAKNGEFLNDCFLGFWVLCRAIKK